MKEPMAQKSMIYNTASYGQMSTLQTAHIPTKVQTILIWDESKKNSVLNQHIPFLIDQIVLIFPGTSMAINLQLS